MIETLERHWCMWYEECTAYITRRFADIEEIDLLLLGTLLDLQFNDKLFI